jgi:hypothetical protein
VLLRRLESAETDQVIGALRELAARPLFGDLYAVDIGNVMSRKDVNSVAFATSTMITLKSPQALPYLVDALLHDSSDVRTSAHRGLCLLSGIDLGPDYEPWKDWLDE